MNYLNKLLIEAAQKSEDDGVDAAYDLIYNQIEKEEWGIINNLLESIDFKLLQDSVLLSILTITRLSEVKKHLPARNLFFKKVKQWFLTHNSNEDTEDLLQGLE